MISISRRTLQAYNTCQADFFLSSFVPCPLSTMLWGKSLRDTRDTITLNLSHWRMVPTVQPPPYEHNSTEPAPVVSLSACLSKLHEQGGKIGINPRRYTACGAKPNHVRMFNTARISCRTAAGLHQQEFGSNLSPLRHPQHHLARPEMYLCLSPECRHPTPHTSCHPACHPTATA